MTVSPSETSSGIRLSPSSSHRPGPTATTVPSCGFSLAVSGMTRPDAVVVSASLACTRILSSSGLIFTFATIGALHYLDRVRDARPDWSWRSVQELPEPSIYQMIRHSAVPLSRRRGCRHRGSSDCHLALYTREC